MAEKNKPYECEPDPIEDAIEKAALELYEKFGAEKLVIISKKYNVTLTVTRPIEKRVIDRYSFSEAHRYLKNAKRRCNTNTPEGYSDCKANCRNALISTLQTLTGKEKVRESTKALIKRGILGEREAEFTEILEKLIVALHGLASKKGSHPPMERNEDNAKLVLSITTSVVNYLINQATRPRI